MESCRWRVVVDTAIADVHGEHRTFAGGTSFSLQGRSLALLRQIAASTGNDAAPVPAAQNEVSPPLSEASVNTDQAPAAAQGASDAV
jgi:hypothetical protein